VLAFGAGFCSVNNRLVWLRTIALFLLQARERDWSLSHQRDSPLRGTVLGCGALSLRESAMSRKDNKLAHFDPDAVSDIIDALAPEVQSWFADTVFEPIPEELAVILRRMDNDG
jgi:hypothetical protein